ncbi:outer mitochondrial transmembrane helix translocase-like [Oppia nitens]|uniref:outer mitochondrial transmembrane helix translocase-like n=1 Tax=Oppia nitens TaxID=1686743 RepID=UPI0023DA3CDB|nr:outer mitochondrial transmembrane helix translocase-like [Oppia nitens]
MSDNSITRAELISIFIRAGILGICSYFAVKWMVNTLDPTRKQKREAQLRAERLLSRLGVKDLKTQLNEYELSIAAQLVDPQSIDVTWNDIAGLEDVIDDIKATVILPIRTPELFVRSELHQPPKGVLLHGPPGCGKTMIAKATAKEAGARFINLEVPALTDKWYGESQKLAAAVFTLALKLQPCIIFIDEIDSFLRSRETHDHEATAMMKAQFMILWDGLISAKHCQVIVMGATNRPQDVDKAILRRMPAMFQIQLPNKEKRRAIIDLVLEREDLNENVDLVTIADITEGFSGSDLKEMCRSSAMFRVKEFSTQLLNNGSAGDCDEREEFTSPDVISSLRPMNMNDFLSAIQKMKESKVSLLTGHSMIGLD